MLMEKTLHKLNANNPISFTLIDLSKYTEMNLEKEYFEEISFLQDQIMEAPKVLVDKLLKSLQKENPNFKKGKYNV